MLAENVHGTGTHGTVRESRAPHAFEQSSGTGFPPQLVFLLFPLSVVALIMWKRCMKTGLKLWLQIRHSSSMLWQLVLAA